MSIVSESSRKAGGSAAKTTLEKPALACRKKFLRYFHGGFADETYIDWERGYKWAAHEKWQDELGEAELKRLIRDGQHVEVAARAVRIESRTNLLFSFEKMALRDAVKSSAGAEAFANGLLAFLHGRGADDRRFEEWCTVIEGLPRKQTRVLTWPVTTVFGFIAQPERHIFLKPNVTRVAAKAYGFDFQYVSRPSWPTYRSLLDFAEEVCADQRDLKPRDMIDAQGFIWVQGSDEY
ncbi:MAG TPA: hypothetical protein VM096_16255 [Vicinamibacterales bacterium]|nr:hypothetical protein [Vicinamibacterales bacterium]